MGFPGSTDGEESGCNAGNPGSIPGLGRPPGGGTSNHNWYIYIYYVWDWAFPWMPMSAIWRTSCGMEEMCGNQKHFRVACVTHYIIICSSSSHAIWKYTVQMAP